MPKLLFSLCFSKSVFINRFLELFASLEILSSLFRLFQSLIDLTENYRPPSVKLLHMGQRKFNFPKCVFLEWTSKFSWSIDFRHSGVFPTVTCKDLSCSVIHKLCVGFPPKSKKAYHQGSRHKLIYSICFLNIASDTWHTRRATNWPQ